MPRVLVQYAQVEQPIKRIVVQDMDCERDLVIQSSRSISGAITMYVSGRPNSRVRVRSQDARDLASSLRKFADQIESKG